jgi:hypothetical protein
VAHGQRNHVVREAMTGERTPRAGREATPTRVTPPALTPSRVYPSVRVAALPHRIHCMINPFLGPG